MILINVPCSAGALGRTQGCEKGPEAIIKQLNEVNGSGRKVSFEQVITVDVDPFNFDLTAERTHNAALQAFENNKDCIILGGDHSLTYNAVRAFVDSKRFARPGLLMFDAHADAVNNFHPPTHEDFLRVLVEENVLDPKNIVLVGLRNVDENELAFLKQKGIRYYSMKQIFSIPDVLDGIMQTARECDGLYVSIDIDVIDPAHAPGTGCPEPGGFSAKEFLYIVNRLKNLKNIRAADIVEVNPTKDVQEHTARLAAAIVHAFF